MSVALIDVGSNTIRLSVYMIEGDGSFERLLSKKITAGLAAYVDDEGALSPEGIDCACEALRYLGTIVDHLQVDDVHVFATASLRNVTNSQEALAAIEQRTGRTVELVSGKEEALLGFSSFRHECSLDRGVLTDIGGGSSEIVCFEHDNPVFADSLKIGSLKLYETCVDKILPTKKELKSMEKLVKGLLDDAGIKKMGKYEVLCGIGGTARAVCKLVNHLCRRERGTNEFSVSDLELLHEVLYAGQDTAREIVLRICSDRVHTITPGFVIFEALARRFGVERILVSQSGVREGYLYERVIGK